MLTSNILPSPHIIDFLIARFKTVGVATQKEQYTHSHDSQIDEKTKERRFYHSDMGYINVFQTGNELNFTIPVLDIFRLCAGKDDLEKVKIFFSLLGKNPNISYQDDNQFNLTNACRFGRLENVKWLVSQGVDIHVEGEINLLAALTNHQYEVAQYLLDTDEMINQEIILSHPQVTPESESFLNKYNLNKKLNSTLSIHKPVTPKVKI